MRAWLYDGVNGLRQALDVSVDGKTLRLAFDDGRVESVPTVQLTAADTRADAAVYGHRDIAGWRLGVPRPLAADLAAALPSAGRYGGWIDRFGLWPMVGAGAAVSAAVLGLGYVAPGWLAPLVPKAWEKSYGEALVGDFGGEFCTGAAGQRALAALTAKLDPKPGELNVRVVDLGMVNAAALPGDNIVIFRRLIAEAASPDELAGVLAHEIAHVRKRHVTEAMLRQFGVGLIVATLGGSTGGNLDAIVSLSYSRSTERAADAGAIASLARAGISPEPTARFFARLAKQEPGLGRFDGAATWLSSHPLSKAREAAFRDSARPAKPYRPALSAEEWSALRAICARPAQSQRRTHAL